MGINTNTLKLKEEITNLINNSNLPAVNVLFILESLLHDVNNHVVLQLQKEKNAIEED